MFLAQPVRWLSYAAAIAIANSIHFILQTRTTAQHPVYPKNDFTQLF